MSTTKAKRTGLLVAGVLFIFSGLAAVGHGANAEKAAHAPRVEATDVRPVSLILMTQEERRAAFLAKQEAERPPLQDRARWACSGFIERALYVPDSAQWVRRSTWPSAPDRGEWFVQATYKAKNRAGVEAERVSICQMRYIAALDEWRLRRVSTARQ